MSGITVTYSKAEVESIKERCKPDLPNPLIKSLTSLVPGFIIAGVGVAVKSAFNTPVGLAVTANIVYFETVSSNEKQRAYDYYNSLYNFLKTYNYDAVKLQFSYEEKYFAARPTKGWDGGYIKVLSELPKETAVHSGNGWIIM